MTEKEALKAWSMEMALKLTELSLKLFELRVEKPPHRDEVPKEVKEDPDQWASYFPLAIPSLEENAEYFRSFVTR